MNPKQFLKPDWRKIVIFLACVGTSYFLPLVPIYLKCPPCTPGALCMLCLSGVEMMKIPEAWDSINQWSGSFYGYKIMYSFLIVELIISYFISCFIIWIYDKVKKKEVK